MLIHANPCLQVDFLFVNLCAVCLDEIKMKIKINMIKSNKKGVDRIVRD